MTSKKTFKYVVKNASEIDINTCFSRVGIIPFFNYEGKNNYFMMKDSKFKEWTDCGGSPEKDEDWLSTCIRETKEESRGFFNFNRDYINKNAVVCYREDLRIAIVFCPFRILNMSHASSICYKYRQDYLKGVRCKDLKKRLENTEMKIFNEETIKSNNKFIYKLVRCVLRAFFRINRVSICEPNQSKRCNDQEKGGYNYNTISCHKGINYPHRRNKYLEHKGVCRYTSSFFSRVDSPTLDS